MIGSLFKYFVALSEFVKTFLYEIRSVSVKSSLRRSEESFGLLRFLFVGRLEVEVEFAASFPNLLKGLLGLLVVEASPKSTLLSIIVGLGLRVVAVVRFFLGLLVVAVIMSILLSTVVLVFVVVVVVGLGRAVTKIGPSVSKSRLPEIGLSEISLSEIGLSEIP